MNIPALLIALPFLFATSVTLAQCELNEDSKLTASDEEQYRRFGESVAISGDVAVVGAIWDRCGGLGGDCGSAYVYRYKGSAWVEEQKLTASDAGPGDYFGRSVSVSGDVFVVGAVYDECAGGIRCGSAYVYRYKGSAWVEEQKLTASDAAPGDYFGHSVSVSGDIAIVGAWGDDCAWGEFGCGSAYVYRYSGSEWVEEQKLTASDARLYARFGASVSVSGNSAVVGADLHHCADGNWCGSAYVYRFNGSTWVQQAKLTASDAASGDLFGASISVSGDVVIVGALYDDCADGVDCGSAYVYRFNPVAPGHWVQQAKLTASDAASGDSFGASISVSGDVVIVGASYRDCAAGDRCGSAYVYRFNGSTWIQQAKLTASDAAEDDLFGKSVSVSGDVGVVGAIHDDCAAGVYCGSAYAFALGSLPRLPDCNRNGVADECDVAFGTSLDCNANGIPDGCDVAACTGDLDCRDCNRNSVPDGCDITSGTAPDCNINGIPDICDIAYRTSQDCNVNDIPDECEGVSCLPVLGACCGRDPFGGCTDGVTLAECSCPRCEWTKLALCDDVACPLDSIPTVSTWGLAILSLLLLVGAKIRFGRLRHCGLSR